MKKSDIDWSLREREIIEKYSCKELSKLYGINHSTLVQRIRRGIPLRQALSKKKIKCKKIPIYRHNNDMPNIPGWGGLDERLL